MMIGVLMGVLCALVTYMDYVAAFLPDDQPQREACDIKRILKEMVTSTVCPCVYVPPRKKKKRKRKTKPRLKAAREAQTPILILILTLTLTLNLTTMMNSNTTAKKPPASKLSMRLSTKSTRRTWSEGRRNLTTKSWNACRAGKVNTRKGWVQKADKLKATTSTVKVFPVATKAANVSAKELAENMKNEMIEEVKNEVKAQATEVANEAKAALVEEVSKIVSVEDMPAVPSSCGNALSQGDDFFVYLLITMPFNQLIAAYTSVGSSLIENPARRASVDGAGLWLLNNDNVVWFIELPVMLLGMFASFSILLAPLLAIVATKVDTIRRTRQNEIVRGYARDGLDNFGKQMTGPRNPKIHGPIVIRKRKQWRKWRKNDRKFPSKFFGKVSVLASARSNSACRKTR